MWLCESLCLLLPSLNEAGEREESQISDERTGSWIRVLFCTGFATNLLQASSLFDILCIS